MRIYVYAYVYIYIYIYIYIFTHVNTRPRAHTPTCARTHTYTHVCVCVCVCACVLACVRACVRVGVGVFTPHAFVSVVGQTWLKDYRGILAMQSSTFDGHVALRAVDGNGDGMLSHQSCSSTKAERNPWWKLTMFQKRFVKWIDVIGRSECGGRPGCEVNYGVRYAMGRGRPWCEVGHGVR